MSVKPGQAHTDPAQIRGAAKGVIMCVVLMSTRTWSDSRGLGKYSDERRQLRLGGLFAPLDLPTLT